MIRKIIFTTQTPIALLAMACTVLMVLPNEESQAAPLRVAVIDTSEKPSAPPLLLDLLVVGLSQEKALVVLERQEIATVLREQGRNLALADEKAKDDLVVAGRIMGADALVLISTESPSEQGLQAIEARIVETRRGIRFGKTVLMWSTDEQAIAQQMQSATEQIASRLRRIQNAKGNFTVVSIAGFRTDELSQETHRFRRNLESWLKSWLASQSGLAVAERTKVLPLIAERKLSDDLPAVLGNADVTIDGTFQLDFSQAEPQVELTLRVIRKDRSVATRTLHAPVSEQAKLRQAAGKAILELLAIEPKEALFDARAEAELLTDEGERLLRLGRRYEALNRLSAAYALDPESYRIQALTLHAGFWLTGHDRSGDLFQGTFYPTALFVCDAARQVIDKIEQGVQPPSDLSFYQSDLLFRTAFRFLRLLQDREVPEQKATEHEWLRAAISSLFHRCLEVTQARGGRPYEGCLSCGMSSDRYWAKTPGEALALRRNLIERADDLDEVGISGQSVLTNDFQFRLDRNKAWADTEDLSALLQAHYENMVASDRIILRVRGEKGLAQHALRYLEDRELAVKHYRQFIDLIVDEIIPHYPKIKYDVGGFWLQEFTDRQGKLGLTDKEAGELWSRVIRARWSRGCPRSSGTWVTRIKPTVIHLEKAGQVDQAEALLQECLDWLENAPNGLSHREKSSQWKKTTASLQVVLAELRARHPHREKQSSSPLELTVDCHPCLTLKQLQPELQKANLLPERFMKNVPEEKRKQARDSMRSRLWKFAGITAMQEGYAVLCAGDEIYQNHNRSRQRLVVARLDQHGKFLSASLCPEVFEQTSPAYNELRDGVLWPLAATEGNISFLSRHRIMASSGFHPRAHQYTFRHNISKNRVPINVRCLLIMFGSSFRAMENSTRSVATRSSR